MNQLPVFKRRGLHAIVRCSTIGCKALENPYVLVCVPLTRGIHGGGGAVVILAALVGEQTRGARLACSSSTIVSDKQQLRKTV